MLLDKESVVGAAHPACPKGHRDSAQNTTRQLEQTHSADLSRLVEVRARETRLLAGRNGQSGSAPIAQSGSVSIAQSAAPWSSRIRPFQRGRLSFGSAGRGCRDRLLRCCRAVVPELLRRVRALGRVGGGPYPR